ncbi:RsiG family protein [Streptomyces sp. WMMC897]|uniref:RsiG family protein n=1 Tax=Streptomyces sp. WMMC897 TaxID=3014782 RepID=UPI0022B6DC77|nr:hypothetical protein [Streptomyces sp. WMMC897]MCZ7417450.1 hypothetical protein [Streptomyces sp. WMMC897]
MSTAAAGRTPAGAPTTGAGGAPPRPPQQRGPLGAARVGVDGHGPGDGPDDGPGHGRGDATTDVERLPPTPLPQAPQAPETAEAAEIARLDLPRLRTLRRTALREEADLSFVRRLLQGRIDILRAELAGRSDTAEPLVERLAQILADGPSRQRSSRHVTVSTPRGEEYRALAESMLGEIALSDLSARTEAELRDAMGRLVRYEAEVSQRRQGVQRTADGCSAEIARRYREGRAHVDDLLA